MILNFINDLFFIIPFFLICISFVGIFIGRKNILLVIICLELLILSTACHYLFIGWSGYGDFKVFILAIMLLTIGACESSIGLAFAIAYYTKKKYV